MIYNIRRRYDGKLNLWRRDDDLTLLPRGFDPRDIRASSWQVIGVFADYRAAEAARDAQRAT